MLAGVVYCQLHGRIFESPAPLPTSLWWSATAVLPGLVVLGQAYRSAAVLHRRPRIAAGVLLAANVGAVLTGSALYRGLTSLGLDSVLHAAPAALAASVFAMITCPPRERPTPAVEPSVEAVPRLFPEAPEAISPADIALVRAEGNYCCLVIGRQEHWLRLPLHEVFRRLAPLGFVQVHRSTLVNAGQIAALRRERSNLVLVLTSGREARVGRAFEQQVRRSSPKLRRSSQIS